jgi:hypothetical protein
MLATLRVEEGLSEAEDRLLRAECGQDVDVGVEDRAEASLDPGGDRASELREAGGAGVRGGRFDPILDGLADERGRLLPGVAHAEVEDRAPFGERLRLAAVQLLERVRLRGSKTG